MTKGRRKPKAIARKAGGSVPLRHRLVKAPADGEAIHLAGLAALREGRSELSAVFLNRAARLSPQEPRYHTDLGAAWRLLKATEAAIASHRRSAVLAPDFTDAYLNLGPSLLSLGLVDEAEEAFQRACRLDPGNPMARKGQGEVWLAKGDFDRSAAMVRDVLAILPQDYEAILLLADIETERGHADAAFALYAAAISLDPGLYPAYIHRALLLTEFTRGGKALAGFDQALVLSPDSAEAWFNRVTLKQFTPDDPDIPRMTALLLSFDAAGSDVKDRVLLNFALGAALLQAGDEERAFAHFHAGNRLKRSALPFDMRIEQARLDEITAKFTPATFNFFKKGRVHSERPVFIVGMPRSGSTLLAQILAAHPDIFEAGEQVAFPQALRRMAAAKPGGHVSFDLSREDLDRLGEVYLTQLEARAGDQARIVDKLPGNVVFAGLIHLALPNARIILTRRDPADTCLSCYMHHFKGGQDFAYDLKELALYHQAIDGLAAHWRAVLPPDRYTEVNYEVLVEDLEGEARRIVAFLGLDWNEACLDFYRSERQVRTASLNQVRQPIYKSSIGKWRRYARHLQPMLSVLEASPDRALIEFAEGEIKRLQAQLAVAQSARNAHLAKLRSILDEEDSPK